MGAVLSAIVTIAFLAQRSKALSPDNVVLIINQNVADSGKLAALYARARQIPADHLITLSLTTGEEMTFDEYERSVVPPVREFLRQHHLDRSSTCLCTFYGVPFRVRARVNTPEEAKELTSLRDQLADVLKQATPVVEQLETFTGSLSPGYAPPALEPSQSAFEKLLARANNASEVASKSINALTDPTARRDALAKMAEFYTTLGGSAELFARFGSREINDPATAPEQRQKWLDLRQRLTDIRTNLRAAQDRRFDAEARKETRQITQDNYGLLNLGQLIEVQMDYLGPGITNSATDSELSLVMWSLYPRAGPQINTLNFKATGRFASPALMVSRLDGPDEPTVERMISTSIAVEKSGLQGGVALNSHGFPTGAAPGTPSAYLQFDQRIQNLGMFIKLHTHLELHEEYSRLYQNREVKNVALYCGWYSLRHYLPGMSFAPGAIGFHVASLEMVGLRGYNETGWVRGLLSDGVVASIGAVAEPYLWSFPPPDEFFPLLMTGKLSLAEIYSRTGKSASWMQCLVGDPLYTPYKTNPAVKVEDLPEELQTALRPLR